jgi:hypothetical protein
MRYGKPSELSPIPSELAIGFLETGDLVRERARESRGFTAPGAD